MSLVLDYRLRGNDDARGSICEFGLDYRLRGNGVARAIQGVRVFKYD